MVERRLPKPSRTRYPFAVPIDGRPMQYRIFIAILLLLPRQVPAQDDLNPWTLNFFLENDLFVNTDLNYTNGVRFSLTSPDLSEFLALQGRTYPWVDMINRGLEPLHPDPASEEPVARNVTLSFGQLMFTPEDRYRADLIVEDRPYAAWLYAGIGYHARTGSALHSLEFTLGMVGPAALGRPAQDLIHDLWGVDHFEGWSHQLKNEPVFQLAFERKHRTDVVGYGVPGGLQGDLITHWGGALGNVGTFLNAGLEARAGWNLPSDFGTSSLRPGGDISAPGLGDVTGQVLRFYGFVAADLRAVAHNLFLDGNTFRRSHSVGKEALVADMAIGVALVKNRWRLSYSHVFRTREFRQQRESQKYGALSVSYSFNREWE